MQAMRRMMCRLHPQPRMQALRLGKLLIRRAGCFGVLDRHNIGMTVYALRQLDLLSVEREDLLRVIQHTVEDGVDARSCANLLHLLANTIREQCDPHVAFTAPLHDALEAVEKRMVEVMDDLEPTECVLAAEGVLTLLPYAASEARTELQHELHLRTQAFVDVVERPVELIGLLKVAMEARRQPRLAVDDDGDDDDHDLARDVLRRLTATVEARLHLFHRRDLIPLVDALTSSSSAKVGAGVKGAQQQHASMNGDGDGEDEVDGHVMSHPLLEECRPLLLHVLADVERLTPQLSPSQCAAWLRRLVDLELLHSHATLFGRLVRQLQSVCASGVGVEGPLNPAQTRSVGVAVLRGISAHGAEAGTISQTDVRRSTKLVLTLMGQLPASIQAMDVHDFEKRASVVRHHVLPLLHELSMDVLADYFTQDSTSATPRAEMAREAKDLATSMEALCSFTLKHVMGLNGREQATIAGIALRWRIYLPHATTTASSSSSSLATSQKNHARREALLSLLRKHSPLSVEQAQRKNVAMCGLMRTSTCFNVLDAVFIINECVATAASLSPPRSSTLRSSTPPSPSSAAEEALLDVARHLHKHVRDELRADLQLLPTTYLVRYLTSLARLDVRGKADYIFILGALTAGERRVEMDDLVRVMGVMGRQQLRAPLVIGLVMQELRARWTKKNTGATDHHQHVGDDEQHAHADLPPSQKVQLLHGLAHSNGQRMIKAPLHEPVGCLFTHADEVSHLNHTEAVFAFAALMQLRQYASPALGWLLSGPLHVDAPTPTTRSCTTMADLLASLLRLGGPREGVPVELILRSIQRVVHALPESKTLLKDLRLLSAAWPVYRRYPRLIAANHKEGLSSSDVAALTSSLDELRATGAALLKPRLLHIAQAADLRPNTFLYGQLVLGAHWGSLPHLESPDMLRLVEMLPVAHLSRLQQVASDYAAAAFVGLLCAQSGATTGRMLHIQRGRQLLSTVRRSTKSLRMEDVLMLLDYGSSLEMFSTAAKKTKDENSNTIGDDDGDDGDVVAIAQSFMDGLRTYARDPRNVSKLSPMEVQVCHQLTNINDTASTPPFPCE